MSQLGADDWVLSLFSEGHKGYFVDVGCGDGEYISNTFKLEEHGWNGLCIDAFPRNFERRNAKVVQALVYSEKDKEVEFCIPQDKDLSGIVDLLGTHKNVVLDTLQERVVCRTSLLQDLLQEHDVPRTIDYMNLDIEGAEYEVLRVFPWNKYDIGCLSVEHNFEEPKATMMHDLLIHHGFMLAKEVKWDSWYVSMEHLKRYVEHREYT